MTDFTAPAQPPVALRSALVGAVRRRRSRIRLRASVVTAASVAVVAALFGGGAFTGGPERVLAIDDGGEWVTVQILDGDAGAAEMSQELQDAGIDGEVQRVPAVPRFDGHWMGIAQVPPCGEGCIGLASTDARLKRNVFRIKRNAIHKLADTRAILYVGRKPEAGETPRYFPPENHDLRIAPLWGPGSWSQAIDPIRVRPRGSR
jgi:hypothetical protein